MRQTVAAINCSANYRIEKLSLSQIFVSPNRRSDKLPYCRKANWYRAKLSDVKLSCAKLIYTQLIHLHQKGLFLYI